MVALLVLLLVLLSQMIDYMMGIQQPHCGVQTDNVDLLHCPVIV
jgi:hypothetical protein